MVNFELTNYLYFIFNKFPIKICIICIIRKVTCLMFYYRKEMSDCQTIDKHIKIAGSDKSQSWCIFKNPNARPHPMIIKSKSGRGDKEGDWASVLFKGSQWSWHAWKQKHAPGGRNCTWFSSVLSEPGPMLGTEWALHEYLWTND